MQLKLTAWTAGFDGEPAYDTVRRIAERSVWPGLDSSEEQPSNVVTVDRPMLLQRFPTSFFQFRELIPRLADKYRMIARIFRNGRPFRMG